MTIEEMKAVKRERGYTYEQVAELSGVPLGTVQKIFCGETRFPRYATLQALERVFRYERVSYDIQEQAFRRRNVGCVAEDTVYQVEKKQGEYTAQDYRELTGGCAAELIDGVFYDLEMPGPEHQRIVGELFRQLANALKRCGGASRVYMAPMEVCLAADRRTLVHPDIMILSDPAKLTARGIQGAPDFVAEVLTPVSRRMDSFQKLVAYMEAGVKEYWLVDPEKRRLTAYWLEQEDFPVMYDLRGSIPLKSSNGELVIDWEEAAEYLPADPQKGTADEISSYE